MEPHLYAARSDIELPNAMNPSADTAIPTARDTRCKALMEIVKLDLFYTEILKVSRNGLVQPKRLVDALIHIDSLNMPDGGARPYNWNRGGKFDSTCC